MTDKKDLPEIEFGENDPSMEQQEKAAMLTQMKVQADLLDVSYASNIGLATLAERVRAAKEKLELEEPVLTVDAIAAEAPVTTEEGIVVPADVAAQYAVFRAKQLVRVSVQCVNPAKSDLQSDLYTVYSSSIGRISQVIPYQAPDGHHMPRALANFLREKTFVGFRPTHKKAHENGVDREHYEIPEFIIRDLPPLTAQEFNRIVQRQDRQQAINVDED